MTEEQPAGVLRAALRTERFTMRSPLDVDEVIERAHRVHEGRLRSKGPSRLDSFLVGIHGHRLVLSKRDHANNSFRPRLIAHLQPLDDGTLIDCEIRPLRFVVGFMATWMTLALAAAVIGISAMLDGVPLGAVGLMFPVAGFGLMWGGFRLARGEREGLRHAIGDVAGPKATGVEP